MDKAALALTLLVAMLAPQLEAFTISLSNCASYLANATYIGLPSGYYVYNPSDVIAGPAYVHIRADVVATAPVEVVVASSSGGFVYQSQPSATISGEYDVSINGSGTYYIGVYNPSSSTVDVYGRLAIEACGPYMPEVWLSPFLALWNTTLGLDMAPMGIATYGVVNANGAYYAYTLKTDAVMGKAYIPLSVVANSYSHSGSYYGNDFSVQLNAYVAVELVNGQTQYYWVQNIVGLENGALRVWDNVWNSTTTYSHLSPSAIRGNGQVSGGRVYLAGMSGTSSGSVPFGWVALEISAGVSGGSVVVRFYANGQNYDTVTITPSAPATSAYIVVAPTKAITGSPLDLELVFAGLSGSEPYAVLKSGSLQFQLYVDVNGAWVPPPSAWTVGRSTYEKGYASVSSSGMGSAAVSPGPPDVEELWSGTVVVGPMGAVATTDTNLTRYFPPVIYFGNGTRLLLEGVYVNGRPATDLSNVPVGSLVVGDYVKQYYVIINAPENVTEGWFDAGSALYIQPVVYFGNGTRLVEPKPSEIVVDRPVSVAVEYTRQYYVVIKAPGNTTTGWFDEGAVLAIQPVVDFGNLTRLVRPTPAKVLVTRPLNLTVSYVKQYYVEVRAFNNATAGWFDAGSVIVVDEPLVVDLGNRTRLVKPSVGGEPLPLILTVAAPLNVTVSYTKQYLVSISSIFGSSSLWADAGSRVFVNASARVVPPAYFEPAYLLVDGRAEPLGPVEASRPLDIRVVYLAEANASLAFLGLPALYAQSQLVCGDKSMSTSAFFAYALELALEDPPAYDCRLSTATVPLAPVIVAAAVAVVAAAIWQRRARP